MPIFLVHIAATSNAKDIFLVNNLFYLQISVEVMKPSSPAQCFACQRFGHGSSNCGHLPRCVKCAGNHRASSCTKTPEQKPTCCNYGGPHTANFRGCRQFLALKQQDIMPIPTAITPKLPTQSTITPKPRLLNETIIKKSTTLNTKLSIDIRCSNHRLSTPTPNSLTPHSTYK